MILLQKKKAVGEGNETICVDWAGFTGRLDNRKRIIEKMMDRIVHRGPVWLGNISERELRSVFADLV